MDTSLLSCTLVNQHTNKRKKTPVNCLFSVMLLVLLWRILCDCEWCWLVECVLFCIYLYLRVVVLIDHMRSVHQSQVSDEEEEEEVKQWLIELDNIFVCKPWHVMSDVAMAFCEILFFFDGAVKSNLLDAT